MRFVELNHQFMRITQICQCLPRIVTLVIAFPAYEVEDTVLVSSVDLRVQDLFYLVFELAVDF